MEVFHVYLNFQDIYYITLVNNSGPSTESRGTIKKTSFEENLSFGNVHTFIQNEESGDF